MSTRTRFTLATITLAVVAQACISDTAVSPDKPIDTLDAALAEVANPALDYASATFSGAGIVTPAINSSRCQFDTTASNFVCDALTGGGLTLNQHYTLLDAVGSRQSGYDMTSTAGLVVNSAVSGTATGYAGGNAVTLTVDAQQELTLSGLGTAQHAVNGTSLTLTTLTRADGAEPPMKSTITTRVVDLVIPVVPGEPAQWPVSGMIELRSTTDLGYVIPLDPSSVVTSAALEFHGSSTVNLTITDQDGTRSCKVNIMTTTLGC